jgi:hypothetical protein
MKNFVTKYPRLSIWIIVIFWTSLGFFIGRLTTPEKITYNSNAQAVFECVEILNQCTEGYGRTLDLLRQSNGLLDKTMQWTH